MTLGIESRGAAKEGGRIGSGDADDVERLSIGVSGDCTPALEQVIGLDGADSVDEAGVLFSWWEEVLRSGGLKVRLAQVDYVGEFKDKGSGRVFGNNQR